MSSLFVALFALVASSFRTRAALQAEILALPLLNVASISHSRGGVAMQTRFSVITTVPELLVLWSSPHSSASLTLRTSTQLQQVH